MRGARSRPPPSRQRGVALLFGVVLFALIGISIVVSIARGSDPQLERDRITARTLAQAKAALIGYAVDIELTGGNRLGGLPCPDMDDDGSAELSCGDGAGSLPATRLGRLPWKTLGLPDLRDGDGERLWYAVSNGFKNSVAAPCSSPADPTCLNSDSRGTITVFDLVGNRLHDGTNPNACLPSGAVAVVIAPGRILTRQGAPAPQNRDPDSLDPSQPQKNPVNFLDAADPDSGGPEAIVDNAVNAERFVNGPLYTAGELVVNDRVLSISYNDILPLVVQRVAQEVSICLQDYASDMTAGGKGRYPWASHTSTLEVFGAYDDRLSGVRLGRIPDPPFARSSTDSGALAMGTTWVGTRCKVGPAFNWWIHWKEHVFYALADAFKPDPAVTPSCGSTGSCLQVLPEATSTRRFVVMVSGARLQPTACAQPRNTISDRSSLTNYLEGENIAGDVFQRQTSSPSFNDFVVTQ